MAPDRLPTSTTNIAPDLHHMEDAEYPAYLKGKSYEDLRSISLSIDQEAQPKRYAMVLAELDQRDKSDGGKALQEDNKRSLNNLRIVGGTLFAIAGVFAICTGHVYLRHYHDIDATKEPVSFWITVGLYFVIAAGFFWRGLIRDRK